MHCSRCTSRFCQSCPPHVQVRDEHRTDFDQGRGGYGTLMWQEIEARQLNAVGQDDLEAAYGQREVHVGYPNKATAARKQQRRDNDAYPAQRNPRARDDDDD